MEYERLARLIKVAPEGTNLRVSSLQSGNGLAKDYLMSLHRLVRMMDHKRRPLGHEPDVHIANRFIRRFANPAGRWQQLNLRCQINPFLKRAVADFFLGLYLPLLAETGINRLFFESGSSIAYLSEALNAGLEAEWARLSVDLEIETNNILSYLEFLSADVVRASLYPLGRPEEKYGATFGPLRNVSPQPAGPVVGEARLELNKVKRYFSERYREKGLGLVFSATSGIDLNPDGRHPGFHVGSYHNKLFKRAVLEAGMEAKIPVVVLADEDKLDYPFNPDKCHPCNGQNTRTACKSESCDDEISDEKRQSFGSSAGVCHRADQPGTPPSERVPSCGESNSPGAPASTAAAVGSGAMHAC
jgi:hypothetical protein